jgi:hypothetical protein
VKLDAVFPKNKLTVLEKKILMKLYETEEHKSQGRWINKNGKFFFHYTNKYFN